MRSILAVFLTTILLLSLVSGVAADPLPASFGLDLMTSYNWRGFNVADEVTIQPSASLDLGPSGFTLDLWSSFASQNRETFDTADRLDFTVAYTKELGALVNPVSFSVGFIEYAFPNGPTEATHTEEFFASVEASLPLISASLSAHRDINLFEVNYIEANVSPPASLLQIMPIPGLDLNLGVGISDYVDSSFAFHDFHGSLSLNLPLGPLLSAGPMVGFAHTSQELAIGQDQNNWWGGVSLRIN